MLISRRADGMRNFHRSMAEHIHICFCEVFNAIAEKAVHHQTELRVGTEFDSARACPLAKIFHLKWPHFSLPIILAKL